MLRVSVATAVTAILALAVLVTPRATVLRTLSFLRQDEAPLAERDMSLQALVAAYPQEVFSATNGARIPAPVLGIGTGPYVHDLQLAEGTDAGIASGAAAVLDREGPGLTLVGKVTDTSGSQATVQTLSDPAWRSAARIGTSSIDALLVGGLVPTLTLIPKTAPVAPGDVVVSADPSLPYGLNLGVVREVRDAPDGVLREATLAVPYSLGALRAVSVLRAGN